MTYKAVRTNMPLKILLQLGEEEVMTLDKAYNFSPRQKEQLTSFNVGWGMLVKDGGEHWPINWRGCARDSVSATSIGVTDTRSRGCARVQGSRSGWISEHKDKDAYVNTRTGYRRSTRRRRPPDDGEWPLFLTKSGTPFPSP